MCIYIYTLFFIFIYPLQLYGIHGNASVNRKAAKSSLKFLHAIQLFHSLLYIFIYSFFILVQSLFCIGTKIHVNFIVIYNKILYINILLDYMNSQSFYFKLCLDRKKNLIVHVALDVSKLSTEKLLEATDQLSEPISLCLYNVWFTNRTVHQPLTDRWRNNGFLKMLLSKSPQVIRYYFLQSFHPHVLYLLQVFQMCENVINHMLCVMLLLYKNKYINVLHIYTWIYIHIYLPQLLYNAVY